LPNPPNKKTRRRKTKKAKRRPGRRGGKAVPGELSEAEANGEAPKLEGDGAPASGDAAKPKKKKKKPARKPKKADGDAAADPIASPPQNTEGDGAPVAEGSAKKPPRVRKPKATRPVRPAGEDPAGEPSKSMIFVANLGFNVDETALSALFVDAGINVINSRIVRRRWGQPRKSKGYGFVDVGNEEEQKKAIAALEGKDIGGRTIAVKIAVNTPHDEGDQSPDGAADAAPADAA